MRIAEMTSNASYQEKITAQMKRLGGSFDWDRVAFTMDDVSPGQSAAWNTSVNART